MSWIIIEGPDDAGKTTLARVLERRGWLYQHAGELDRLPFLATRMAEVQDQDNVVWDRNYLGEVVHNTLDRGVTTDPGWLRLIEAFLLERSSSNILLTERVGDSQEWENDRVRHDILADNFYLAAQQSFLHWHRGVPPLPENPDEEPDLEPWSIGRPDPEGLGAIEPLVWILGERQNENAQVPWPLATRCGTELIWPVVDPKHVRVSNALPSYWRNDDVNNIYTDLQNRWQELGRPRVITLGKQAEKACQMADVAVRGSMPHPQFWLRFHARDLARYRTELDLMLLTCEREALEVIML